MSLESHIAYNLWFVVFLCSTSIVIWRKLKDALDNFKTVDIDETLLSNQNENLSFVSM